MKKLLRLSEYNSLYINPYKIVSIYATLHPSCGSTLPHTIKLNIRIVYENSPKEFVYGLIVDTFGELKAQEKLVNKFHLTADMVVLGNLQRAFPLIALEKIIEKIQGYTKEK